VAESSGSLAHGVSENDTRIEPSLVRTSAVFIAILLASYGADYLGQVLFGRWLGAVDYGDFGVSVSLLVLLASLFTFGSDETVPRFLPAYLAEDRHGHVRGFLRGHLAVITVSTLLLCLTGMGAFLFIGWESFDHPVRGIWWILPFVGVGNFLYNLLANHDRSFTVANLVQMVATPLLMTAIGFILLSRNGGLTDHLAVVAYGISVAAILPIYWVLLRRSFPAEVWKSEPSYDLSLWMRTALPIILTALVYYVLGQADIYVMEHVGDEKDVGILLACIKTSDLVFLSYTASLLILSSRISPLVAAGRTEELRLLIRRFVRLIFVLSVLVAVGMIVCGKPMLRLFGAGFEAGYPALVVMAAANVLIGTLSLAWPLLSYSGHERVPVPGFVVALVLLVGLAEVAIPRYGLIGAACCKSLVMALLFAWLAWQVRAKLGIRLWRLI
jgi:O-antigen/teichoic acid export membrane protein